MYVDVQPEREVPHRKPASSGPAWKYSAEYDGFVRLTMGWTQTAES